MPKELPYKNQNSVTQLIVFESSRHKTPKEQFQTMGYYSAKDIDLYIENDKIYIREELLGWSLDPGPLQRVRLPLFYVEQR